MIPTCILGTCLKGAIPSSEEQYILRRREAREMSETASLSLLITLFVCIARRLGLK